jgi:hypothetical protein
VSASRHASGCECPASVSVAEAAPLRASLIEAIEAFFMHRALIGGAWPAADLADDLISNGLFPDELRWQ